MLAAIQARDVAVLWIDAASAAALKPVPLGCGESPRPTVASGQKIFTIGTPLGQPKGMLPGTVRRVDAHAIHSDLVITRGSSGISPLTRSTHSGATTSGGRSGSGK